MAGETLNGILVDEIRIFQEMPLRDLKLETDDWPQYRWDTVRSASETSPETKSLALETMIPMMEDLYESGVIRKEKMENLEFYKFCMNMPQATLERMLQLAPQE